jgi:hypothetical protein
MTVYSTKKQFEEIARYLTAYMRIPYFQDDNIPGKVMEKIFSLVRKAEQLNTYDYVDVVIRNEVGWQIKSTKSSTPLTWKRAKIKNSNMLIKKSEESEIDRQNLGNSIIDFCNKHAEDSMKKYKLKKIGYSRLIMLDNNIAIYFEREVCAKEYPIIFEKNNFTWKWSKEKNTKGKEQLPALHGTDLKNNQKAFSWHGRGENQLHFSGERYWWPKIEMPSQEGEIKFSEDCHAISFTLPTDKVDWVELTNFLNRS